MMPASGISPPMFLIIPLGSLSAVECSGWLKTLSSLEGVISSDQEIITNLFNFLMKGNPQPVPTVGHPNSANTLSLNHLR